MKRKDKIIFFFKKTKVLIKILKFIVIDLIKYLQMINPYLLLRTVIKMKKTYETRSL